MVSTVADKISPEVVYVARHLGNSTANIHYLPNIGEDKLALNNKLALKNLTKQANISF